MNNVRKSDNPVIKELTEILDSMGIEIAVGGCGCCGSPYFFFMVRRLFMKKIIGFTNVKDTSDLAN